MSYVADNLQGLNLNLNPALKSEFEHKPKRNPVLYSKCVLGIRVLIMIFAL